MTLSAVATRYAHALADVVTAGGVPPARRGCRRAIARLRSRAAALPGTAERADHAGRAGQPQDARWWAGSPDILGLSRIARNFLFVLVDHRRIASLAEIIHSFELVVDERLGFARAEVSSARRTDRSAARRALAAELERLTGKRIRARFAVDGALIGGVVARIGSTVYDGSVRGQLESLERRLGAES